MRERRAPRLAIVATRASETNLALAEAAAALGVPATVMTPQQAAERLRPGDLALGRLDVLPSLDGVEPGLWQLRGLARRGIRVLNPAGALTAAHDKLATARRLRAAGLPHPRTAALGGAERGGRPAIEPPLVLKPRFGSWGRAVVRCETADETSESAARLRRMAWFRRGGAVVQELVPPRGSDLRLVVAGGEVVGAVRRVAAAGEWRTNVALGATRIPASPPLAARVYAVAAAAAVAGDLVGVDLLPTGSGWTVLEVNGAVDFNGLYAPGGDVFEAAVSALVGAAEARPLPTPARTSF
jgi:[lysine-biosynthesis-protein LysW]--L-2-aminoadipate ligase